jgi:hypothetical protein
MNYTQEHLARLRRRTATGEALPASNTPANGTQREPPPPKRDTLALSPASGLRDTQSPSPLPVSLLPPTAQDAQSRCDVDRGNTRSPLEGDWVWEAPQSAIPAPAPLPQRVSPPRPLLQIRPPRDCARAGWSAASAGDREDARARARDREDARARAARRRGLLQPAARGRSSELAAIA